MSSVLVKGITIILTVQIFALVRDSCLTALVKAAHWGSQSIGHEG